MLILNDVDISRRSNWRHTERERESTTTSRLEIENETHIVTYREIYRKMYTVYVSVRVREREKKDRPKNAVLLILYTAALYDERLDLMDLYIRPTLALYILRWVSLLLFNWWQCVREELITHPAWYFFFFSILLLAQFFFILKKKYTSNDNNKDWKPVKIYIYIKWNKRRYVFIRVDDVIL